jgi:hypothetical protein
VVATAMVTAMAMAMAMAMVMTETKKSVFGVALMWCFVVLIYALLL